MTLAEIMQKITELSPEDRALLRRELEETLSKCDVEKATPELRTQIDQARVTSGDERGLPIEDVIEKPKQSRLDPKG
jgi:hypothetical protein